VLGNHRTRSASRANLGNNVDLSGGDARRAAGRDAVDANLGSPVYPSGPRAGATNKLVTADRKSEALLPSADSRLCSSAGDELLDIPSASLKRGGGVGGGAPDGCTLLDKQSVTVTRVPVPVPFPVERELSRGKHCGLWTLRGKESDGSLRFHRLHCKAWKCSRCGPKKAKHYRHAITTRAVEHRLQHMMTLTVDPLKIEGDPVQHLNRCFADLRVYLYRRLGFSVDYIRVMQWHKNGRPHLHVLVGRRIDIEWLKAAWIAIGGASNPHRVQVKMDYADIHRIANYVSRYMSRELLISPTAPNRMRRVTASKGIHLNEKREPSTAHWTMERHIIEQYFEAHAADVIVTTWDGECLQGFATGPPANLLAA
jgi:hypothetical protein